MMKSRVRRSCSSRYGLVAAGAAGRGLLARLPVLRTELGPVISSSKNGAGRIVKVLGSGNAASDPRILNECTVVLACAPNTGLDRVIALLENDAIAWGGRVLLFCDSNVSSIQFPQLIARGASVGSLNSIAGTSKLFVTEGKLDALREAKCLVKMLGGKPVEVTNANLFDAGRTWAGSLFTPLVDSCIECVTKAGLSRKAAVALAEILLVHALRSYIHAGRRSWSGPIADQDRDAIVRQYLAIQKVNPLRGEYFRNSADSAFKLYRMFPELARYLPKRD